MIAILNGLFSNPEINYLFSFFVGALLLRFLWRLIYD